MKMKKIKISFTVSVSEEEFLKEYSMSEEERKDIQDQISGYAQDAVLSYLEAIGVSHELVR